MNFNFHDQRLKSYLLTLPAKMGTEAVNFTKENFRVQGFQDSSFSPWAARKTESKGRAILVLRGALRRSIRITAITSGSVTIGTAIPYARIHNEGFKGTVQVRAHNRTKFNRQQVGTGKFTKAGKERQRTVMQASGSTPVRAFRRNVNIPQRKFLGSSPVLEKRIITMIKNDLNTIFKA